MKEGLKENKKLRLSNLNSFHMSLPKGRRTKYPVADCFSFMACSTHRNLIHNTMRMQQAVSLCLLLVLNVQLRFHVPDICRSDTSAPPYAFMTYAGNSLPYILTLHIPPVPNRCLIARDCGFERHGSMICFEISKSLLPLSLCNVQT